MKNVKFLCFYLAEDEAKPAFQGVRRRRRGPISFSYQRHGRKERRARDRREGPRKSMSRLLRWGGRARDASPESPEGGKS